MTHYSLFVSLRMHALNKLPGQLRVSQYRGRIIWQAIRKQRTPLLHFAHNDLIFKAQAPAV
jgi:hypothetical protein